ncbi:hypothetical protein SAMN00120144_3324 [Hymenobacter roseosalivarius DSM 11622]|uniref:Uncharacterized protein n=1 Tax=Hymenobacter roseosalivarius DSM 11622 TaxID=645990 RepID=A0A1W1VHV1_9BACT|nr:hypothetical protein [Hymenobacter roseosalivarius]SMB92937.1 hypothetical protein SAMN00120144_3324 [Hymenobacter roseosalivarius DSM 11622]
MASNNGLRNLGLKLRKAQKPEVSRLNHKRNKTQRSVIHFILYALSILGLGLTVLEIKIYQQTLISATIPILIYIFTTLTATLFTRQLLKKHFDTGSIFLQLCYNLMTWGGIAVYIFMSLNYYLASDNSLLIRTEVLKNGNLAKGRYGCGEPYVEVYINGVNKQIMFPCGFNTKGYTSAKLTIKKGLFGFNIITNPILEK